MIRSVTRGLAIALALTACDSPTEPMNVKFDCRPAFNFPAPGQPQEVWCDLPYVRNREGPPVITWASSNAAMATARAGRGNFGEIEMHAHGSVTITARYRGWTTSFQLTSFVGSPPVLKAKWSTFPLPVGMQACADNAIDVTPIDGDGSYRQIQPGIATFAGYADTSIVAVANSRNGCGIEVPGPGTVIRGVSAGSAKVRVTYAGISTDVDVSVVP